MFWTTLIFSAGLTPGLFPPTHRLSWDLFDAGFWPVLCFRTIAAMAIAGLCACVVVVVSGSEDREARRELMGHFLKFLGPMTIIPLVGIWCLASFPAGGPFWVPGWSIAKIICTGVPAVASVLLGGYGLYAFWHAKIEISRLAMALLCVLALASITGGELVLDAIREPDSFRPPSFSEVLRHVALPKDGP
jgi:hypothetical protein